MNGRMNDIPQDFINLINVDVDVDELVGGMTE